MKFFLIIVVLIVILIFGMVFVSDFVIFWVINSGGMESMYIVVMGEDLNVQYQQIIYMYEGVWVVNFGSIQVDEVVLISNKLLV